MIESSALSKVILPTISRQFFMMARQFDDVIDFTLGDPDIPTPKGICNAAYRASLNGGTHYAPNAGLSALRAAIARYENEESGINYSASNVAVTMGATEAIYLAFLSIVNPGDEVIILAPYWAQYENIVKMIGAKPVIINCKFDFEPNFESLKVAITPKTKVLVVNSPNNPSGHVYGESTLRELASLAINNNLIIFADEVYKGLTYGQACPSMATCCPKDRLIVFNSFSKQFAMTGWRVGYVVACEDIIKTIVKFQQNIAVCVASPNQYAALEALSNASRYSTEIRNTFFRRREVIKSQLDKVGAIRYTLPEGAFYVFLDISATGLDSKTFCYSLFEEEHVAAIPGVAFGDAFDHFIRLAFTVDDDKIIKGITKINRFIISH